MRLFLVNNRNTLLLVVASWIILMLSASDLSAAPSSQESMLFSDATSRGNIDRSKEPGVKRQRTVNVNFRLLNADSTNITGNKPTSLRLNLFSDLVLTAVLDRVEPTSTKGGFVWIGHIVDDSYSQVVFVIQSGILVGDISLRNAMYEVRFTGNGVHSVSLVSQDPSLPHSNPLGFVRK